jgi:diamine N-acetyltransferase
MKLEFRAVDKTNWEDCIELKVHEHQKSYITDNTYSILQAQYDPDLYPFGIYDGSKLVGFVMYGLDSDTKRWEMCRLMIDKEFQNKGYGKEAVLKILDEMKEKFGKIEFFTSVEPQNIKAQKLFEKIGFSKTGEIMWDEEVMKIQL